MEATYDPVKDVECPREFMYSRGPAAFAQRLRERAGYVIQPDNLNDLAEALVNGLHLLCEGEPGSGKTALGECISLSFNLPEDFLHCHEELTREDLLGYFDEKAQDRAYKRALERGNSEAEAEAAQWVIDCFRPGAFLYPFHFTATSGLPSIGIWDEVEKLRQAREIMAYGILARGNFHLRELKPYPFIGVRAGGTLPLIVATTNDMKTGEKRGDADSLTEPFRDRFITTFVNTPGHADKIQIIRAQVPDIARPLLGQLVKLIKEIELTPEIRKKPTLRRIINLARSLTRTNVGLLDVAALRRKLCYLSTHRKDRINLAESVGLLMKRANERHADIDGALEKCFEPAAEEVFAG
jgi:MoxR-like ATPase